MRLLLEHVAIADVNVFDGSVFSAGNGTDDEISRRGGEPGTVASGTLGIDLGQNKICFFKIILCILLFFQQCQHMLAGSRIAPGIAFSGEYDPKHQSAKQ